MGLCSADAVTALSTIGLAVAEIVLSTYTDKCKVYMEFLVSF